MRIRKIRLALLALGLLAAGCASAQSSDGKTAHKENMGAVESWTQAHVQQNAGNSNVWIRQGIVANRLTHKVEIVAQATGLEAGSIAEFLLVGPKSEKDYEAMAVSFATPGDVARGLEFIGLPRGRTINARLCQFWPKGERVRISVRTLGRAEADAVPLFSCLTDKRPNHVWPSTFVYTGSRWTGDVATATCLADSQSSGSIVSTYNEPVTVLDIPVSASQGEVYGNVVVAKNHSFEKGGLLVLDVSPEPRADGQPRVINTTLTARRNPAVTGAGLAMIACVSAGVKTAEWAVATNDVQGALARFAALAQSGRDPFVTLALDDNLSVAAARDLAQTLKMIEGEGGIRIEPPPDGQLYYRAFLPDEKWRTRSERFSQPFELRVGRDKNGVWRATLVQILEDWSKKGQLTPDLTPKEFPLEKAEDLPVLLKVLAGKSKEELPNTLFVFVPADAPLGVFMPAVRLVHDALPMVHVFAE
jgi:hypothetical protein